MNLNLINDMTQLDLHGYRITETTSIIESFIEDHILYGTEKIEIITGNNEKVKKILKNVSELYGVTLKPHLYNREVFIISL